MTGALRSCVALGVALLLACAGCSRESGAAEPGGSQRSVVVFTALDRVYSEPILKRFEEKTGLRVRPVYDAEAAKTTGLVTRLLARADDPECDVFWNNEVVQTESLAQRGVLEAYRSPAADRIPARFRDPDGRWTGFAARLRVLIYNKNAFPSRTPPTELGELSAFTNPAHRDRAAIALPFYGTTFTHVCVMHHEWGAERLSAWLRRLRDNGVAVAPGNGAVRDLVASGQRAFGLTDTDDAYGAIAAGKPVGVLVPEPSRGAVLIPNTVSLVRKAPHAAEGRLLIDYLLSPEVERALAAAPGKQIPLGDDLKDLPTPWTELLRGMPVRELDVPAVARQREAVVDLLRSAGMGG